MGVVAYLSLSGSEREVGWDGRLFEGGRLLTHFSAFSMGAYSRWAVIRGSALIRINTVFQVSIRAHPCRKTVSIPHNYAISFFLNSAHATTQFSFLKSFF